MFLYGEVVPRPWLLLRDIGQPHVLGELRLGRFIDQERSNALMMQLRVLLLRLSGFVQ